MDHVPSPSLRERNRQLARETVLDAAERLLEQDDGGDFSMRALAAEAGVGFATPFNHFGNKNTIMQALSARVIDRMALKFQAEAPPGDAIDRTLAMAAIAVKVLLEKPKVYRTVVGSLGTIGAGPNAGYGNSRALWALALGDFEGIAAAMRSAAEETLDEQLVFMFRGCLSFWIAGEFDDRALSGKIRSGFATVLLGFSSQRRHAELRQMIEAGRGGVNTRGSREKVTQR